MKYALLALALLQSLSAYADDSARQAKIAAIMEAQGLQQQLDLTKGNVTTIGEHFYRRALLKNCLAHSANCNAEGQANPTIEQVYTQFVERNAALSYANGYAEPFSGYTDAELDEILDYYKLSAGKSEGECAPLPKKVLTLSLELHREGLIRMNRELGRMLKELDEIVCPNVSDASDPTQCVLSTQSGA